MKWNSPTPLKLYSKPSTVFKCGSPLAPAFMKWWTWLKHFQRKKPCLANWSILFFIQGCSTSIFVNDDSYLASGGRSCSRSWCFWNLCSLGILCTGITPYVLGRIPGQNTYSSEGTAARRSTGLSHMEQSSFPQGNGNVARCRPLPPASRADCQKSHSNKHCPFRSDWNERRNPNTYK